MNTKRNDAASDMADPGKPGVTPDKYRVPVARGTDRRGRKRAAIDDVAATAREDAVHLREASAASRELEICSGRGDPRSV